MKTVLLSMVILVWGLIGHAQLYNYGALIRVDTTSELFISDSYEHHDGILENRGLISLKGSWLNYSDKYSVDFMKCGTVDFSGAAQEIGGFFPLQFDSLILSGKGTKKMSTFVQSNWLDLQDAELASENNIFHLSNPAPGGIVRRSGFISAKQKGGVCIVMNVPSTDYLIPLGYRNSFGTPVIRPVNLSMPVSDSVEYLLSVVNSNDLKEGINYNERDNKNLETNHYYVHHVSKMFGKEPIKVDFLFNTQQDINANLLLRWNNRRRILETIESDYSPQSLSDLNGKITVKNMDPNIDSTYILAYENLSNLIVPNTITPNGDGDHDTWNLDFLKYFRDVEIEIYNRYGSKVFESKENYKPWDGKYQGNTLPVGSYYYIINLNKGKQVLKGWLAIIL
ncbi:MAG: hypothetical protein NVSMB45_18800 [Ginsengibacter sp.]